MHRTDDERPRGNERSLGWVVGEGRLVYCLERVNRLVRVDVGVEQTTRDLGATRGHRGG